MTTVFIHGLGQTPAAWEGVLRHMRAAGETPLCANLPALLRGEKALYETLYQRLAAQLVALGPEVRLCGLSLGAVLALDYALRHPGGVEALALIAPQYKMPKLLLKLQSAAFRRLPQRSFAQLGFSREAFLSLTASMSALDFSRDIPGLTCRTLVLVGERDRSNRKAALGLCSLLPQAEYAQLPGSGHEANLDAPEGLAQRLDAFFAPEAGTPLGPPEA